MAVFGTPFVSSTFSRVTGDLSRSVILANLSRQEAGLLNSQEQLATGRRIIRPSDDPIGTNVVLDFELEISRRDQFDKTIDTAAARVERTDFALQQAKDLLDRARVIALQQANDSSTPDTRRAAALEMDQLLNEAVSLGNTRVEGRFIFGGNRTDLAPFAQADGAVVFQGDEEEQTSLVAEGLSVATSLSGARAFNALSSEILGSVDLDPGVIGATRLAVFNQGEGVRPGSILIGDGVLTPQVVDLSGSETLQNVIDKINAVTGATGVTASVSPAPPLGTGNGIRLSTGTGTVVVDEVGGGSTARDLGIFTGSVGAPAPPPGFEGADLDPVLTPQTTLAELFDAAGGLDPAGLRITNALPGQAGTPVDVSLAGTATIEDVLNRLNNAGVFVEARINGAGNGLDVVSRLNGGRMRIEEIGAGTTAAQLGLLYTLGIARIEDVNNGLGVDTAVAGDDLQFTLTDGSVIRVDIGGAETVQDVIDLINSDSENGAGFLTASVNPLTGDSLLLTDTSGGAGTFATQSLNGSRAVQNLQIDVAAVGGTITGDSLQPAGVQARSIYTVLVRLREALEANDPLFLNAAMRQIDPAQQVIEDSMSLSGSRGARLEATRLRISEEKLQFERLLTGVRDADIAEVATRLQVQQVTLQAGLAAAARILQTTLFNFL
ncbi:MAG: flagellar hook-associated protein FlgL [Planctomycetota bacterium]